MSESNKCQRRKIQPEQAMSETGDVSRTVGWEEI